MLTSNNVLLRILARLCQLKAVALAAKYGIFQIGSCSVRDVKYGIFSAFRNTVLWLIDPRGLYQFCVVLCTWFLFRPSDFSFILCSYVLSYDVMTKWIRGFSTTMRYINRHYLSIYLSIHCTRRLAQLMQSFGCTQHVAEPTHTAGHSLNLIITTADTDICNVHVGGLISASCQQISFRRSAGRSKSVAPTVAWLVRRRFSE